MTACNGVGWNLSRGGYGIAADVVSAARYFKRACGSDSPEACTNIGYAYDHGLGVNKDVTLAISYYKQACDLGNSMGCSNHDISTRPAQIASSRGNYSSGSTYDSGTEDFLEWERNRYIPPPYVPPPPVTPIGGSGGFYGCSSPPCM